ncbi:uncharacterized protein LOC111136443 [Crassostrea virginica]
MILLAIFSLVTILLTTLSDKVNEQDNAHPRLRRYLTPYPIPPLPPGSVTQIPTDSPKSLGFAFPVHFAPVPCSPDRSKRTSLSQEHLMELLLKKGGSFRPSLMAIDKKSAHSSFPNLLPFAQDKENYIKDVDIPVSKQKLLDDLDKWNTFFKSPPKIQHPVSSEYHNYLQRAMALLGSELGDYIIKTRINPEDIINFISAHDIVHHPKILSYVKKPDHRWKRQSPGNSTQFCQYRGNKTDAGFINFCTSCVSMTDLGRDKFPRYINEILCNVEPCLSVNRYPHGACQENLLHLTFLRRAPDGCLMFIQDTSFGQNRTFTDLWESYTQQIRVGCSCKLDKRSRLRETFGFGK